MKTNSSINACFVGCGRIAKKHFDCFYSKNIAGLNLKTVCDIEPQKFDKFDFDSDLIKASKITEIISDSSIDLAVIMTESGNHYKHAKIFVERGIDVLIEKPVTLKLTDAYKLRDLASRNNSKIYVVKQNRYNKAVKFAKRIIKEEKLGRLNLGTVRVRWCRRQDYYDQAPWRGTWKQDGGVISNQAIHHIDLLQWFMGPVRSVSAFSNTFGVNIEAEDSIVGAINFESGAIGSIEATTSIRPINVEGSVSLIGQNGYIEIGGHAANEIGKINFSNMEENLEAIKNENTADVDDVYGDGHEQVYREILSDRLGAPNSAVQIDEAIKSLKIIHMMYKSTEQNRIVHASELSDGSEKLGI